MPLKLKTILLKMIHEKTSRTSATLLTEGPGPSLLALNITIIHPEFS